MESWVSKLSVIEPRKSVSVTAISSQTECLLALHAPRTASVGWPISIRSRLGTIVHNKLEELASEPDLRMHLIENTEARNNFLNEALQSEGIDFRQINDAWYTAMRAFSRALTELPNVLTSPRRDRGESAPTFLPEEHVSDSQTEGWVIDLQLGVHGKFDLRIVNGNEIRIDDFKTSCVGGDAAKLKKWMRQASIYTLISWRANPDKMHKSRIIASDGVFDVSISEQSLRALEEELMDRKLAWPTFPTAAEELSTIGGGCRSCNVRHVCPAYLSRTPWLEDAEMDHSNTMTRSWDVWGEISRLAKSGARHGLVLETEEGTRVIVNGFPPTFGLDGLSVGDTIGIFGLRKDRIYTSSHPVFRVANQSVDSTLPRFFLRETSADNC